MPRLHAVSHVDVAHTSEKCEPTLSDPVGILHRCIHAYACMCICMLERGKALAFLYIYIYIYVCINMYTHLCIRERERERERKKERKKASERGRKPGMTKREGERQSSRSANLPCSSTVFTHVYRHRDIDAVYAYTTQSACRHLYGLLCLCSKTGSGLCCISLST